MPKPITDSQELTKRELAILVALGTYKFLSTAQIVKWSIIQNKSASKTPQNYYPSLKKLETLGTIKRRSHKKEGWGNGGRLPDIIYLTPAGRKVLLEMPDCPISEQEIRYVSNFTVPSAKFVANHKMAVADFLIFASYRKKRARFCAVRGRF
jgi:DNA-binding PadR family transcriptional regulator